MLHVQTPGSRGPAFTGRPKLYIRSIHIPKTARTPQLVLQKPISLRREPLPCQLIRKALRQAQATLSAHHKSSKSKDLTG